MLTRRHALQAATVLAIGAALPGCSTLKNSAPVLRRAASVTLDYTELASALRDIHHTYIHARSHILANRIVFDEAEWRILKAGNNSVVALNRQLKQLLASDQRTLVIDLADLITAIQPVRDSVQLMKMVIDDHVGELSTEATAAYLEARSDFDQINGKLDAILSRGDNAERTRALIELAKTIARIAGIVLQFRNTEIG